MNARWAVSSAAHKDAGRGEDMKKKGQRTSVSKWEPADMDEVVEVRKMGRVKLRTERAERSRMLLLVKLYRSSPSEAPCDHCVLSGSALHLQENKHLSHCLYTGIVAPDRLWTLSS